MIHLWRDIDIGPNAPHGFDGVIEIPKGSKIKCELEKKAGLL